MTRLVSTLMPVYNSAKYIAEAIESVLNQQHKALELIIVDDGSTDGSDKVISAYLHDKRIRFIQQNNAGPASARNTGLRAAKGSLIAYCDADDIWQADKLAIQVPALLAHPEIGMLHTARTAIDVAGNVIGHAHKRETAAKVEVYNATRKLFQRNYLSGPSALLYKSCFDKVGMFDESFALSSDHEFLLRLSTQYKFGYLNQELHKYRKHPEQVTSNRQLREEYKEKILTHFIEQFPGVISEDDINRAYANIHKSRGHDLLKQDKNPSGARKEFLKSLAYQPINPSVWLRYLRSYLD
jgi:glycosyltransferase involved in cell wall biosynthesis